jgi:hypothetical protein
MITSDPLMACVDCLMFVANGDEPEDESIDLGACITAHLDLRPLQHLVCGDSEQDDEFSWRACECCGSTLGGSRHQLFLLTSES